MNETATGGQEWDAVIVGTGPGGATLGHALATAGWRVLFCEMGRSSLVNAPALRGEYPEMSHSSVGLSLADGLRFGGRYPRPIRDLSADKEKQFVPFIGAGTGGSSALYGMVLERFFPADFEPRVHHPELAESSLPVTWPIGYADLQPYYEAAERLYGVRGGGDPLRGELQPERIAVSPPMSCAARELADGLARQGMHPYPLPLGCEFVPGCKGCQGFLCAANCKNDSARACLEPAIAHHGAQLLDECEVVEVEADRERVTGLVCRRAGRQFRVSGRIVVIAAGALSTPALLLQSRSDSWPNGVGNGSGLVGKNLMRHFIDLYAVFSRTKPECSGNTKEFGFNDLYVTDGIKLGAVQSFGKLPPGAMIADDLQRDLRHGVHAVAAAAFGLVKPMVRPLLDQLFSRATILATIIEDLPYAANCVLPPSEGRELGLATMSIRYTVRQAEAQRIAAMRSRMKALLRPWRYILIKQAENNERIAHACGTCRFGDDPAQSVLDVNNRCHDLENLYIVDASFFPSSGGTNPALTIAANALRVADHLLGKRTVRTAA
ncbi:GMC family oxidoreductase [Aromatoleum evansii]|uniref:GMC family oxidoreductase n=1 Tax=Aromatoleum evansii TaxID=59406 RepID=A0ABZ1AH56_AROEV|nr:GMC family oxidoreductase [Aromatoleum evansii]